MAMDRQQRFLKRLHLMERIDLWLREAAYHRQHHEDHQLLPQIPVWNWGEEEGQGNLDVATEELDKDESILLG